ncbi:MAG: hypothetical protein JWP11_1167 [Frankiales bacterium]|nr:hypothetical protein [Frankiales bacterium]
MRPEETSFVQEVHVDVRPTAMNLSCDRCGAVEVILLGSGEFDDNVKRFMRTHPHACSAGSATS